MRALAVLLTLLGLSLPAAARAQLNPFYPVQGVLTDAAGAPINGALQVVFALYEADTSASSLWSETVTVEFDEGLFSVYLGEANTLAPSLFAGNDGLWLGVTVGADPEMDRVFLASSPYAGYAEHAGQVTASAVQGVLGVGQLPNAAVVGPQGCPGGSYAIGLDVSGNLTCLAGPTGATFALSNQACAPGAVVVGFGANGAALCEAPYTSEACPAGSAVTGFDATGAPVCAAVDSLITASGGPLTVGTDLAVTGDLTVTGTLTVGGESFGYPSSPRLLFGREEEFCTASSGENVGWVTYPARFPADPVFVGGMDESLNDSGASWIRTHQSYRNRAGLRCSSNLDALHWIAVEPGVHSVDNKTMEAGITSGVSNGSAVFFSQVFGQTPVVLLQIDQTGNQSGATHIRLINVTPGGFELWVDGQIDNVAWIAMDPGEYTWGRWRWFAGVFANSTACAASCTWTLPSGMFADAVNAVMTVHDTNNSGATYVRHRALSPTAVTARMDAASEEIHYVAWEPL